MKNIILIGMPACGKSTIGVLLAKTVGFSFLDTDLIIQRNERRRLQQIIEQDGLAHFRESENRALLSVDAEGDTVIATGGSAVFCDEGMEKLKAGGICVYLHTPLEEIIKRLDNIQTRGIAAQKGKSVEEIFAERAPLYEKYADIVIKTASQSSEKTVEAVAKALEI